jgi:hypothetical protein
LGFLAFPIPRRAAAADGALYFVVAQRLRLSDQQRKFRRQFLPLLDEAHKRFPCIIEVHKCLTTLDVARIEMTQDLPFINARDLLR